MGRGEGSGFGSGWGFGMGSGYYKGKRGRFWVPALPMPAAITCCVLNFLIPGLVEYYHNNKVDDDDRINVAPTTSVVTTTVVTQQPFQPLQVPQGTQPGPYVTTQQPVAPPPYQGTSSVGMNPSGSALYPDSPQVTYADGSEQKLAV